jgi:MFS family permease
MDSISPRDPSFQRVEAPGICPIMSRMTASSSPGTPAPAAGGATRKTSRIPLFTADAWAPLKVELFRNLWIATSIAQIGTWMREAAGPTLMENLTHSLPNRAEMVTRVLTFSNLPICLFSVIAGALADVLDRRRLLIITQLWMVAVSFLLGLLTYLGMINPWGLLILTFLLGMGTAAFGPALQAVLPELVPREQFALAINMNSIALNVARALGPALFIVVVTLVPGNRGAGVSFMLAGASFLTATWVLFSWKRPPQRAALAGEQMWDAIRAGFRYTVYSPANRAILLRVVTFIIPALVIWSLVPIIATNQLGYLAQSELERQRISALLFAFMGFGAVFGVFLMPGLHARYRIDPVVNVCTFFFGAGLICLAYVHHLWLAAIILVFLGINWVIIPTNFNTATQKSVPPWVKGRAISFYLTVLFGSFAVGAALWGKFTIHHGIHATLLAGGISMLCLLTLAIWFPLTINEGKDLAPAYADPPTDRFGEKPQGTGPVRVATRYRVPTHRSPGFQDVMRDLRMVRLRNGASRWELEPGEESDGHTLLTERITFSSWQEYTRSFSRATKGDLLLESLTREYHHGSEPPTAVAEEARRGFAVRLLGSRSTGEAIAPPVGESGTAVSAHPGNLARPAGPRLHDRIADALDRAIDEAFVAYDRFANAPKRKTAWRHLIIQFPANIVIRENDDGERLDDESRPKA